MESGVKPMLLRLGQSDAFAQVGEPRVGVEAILGIIFLHFERALKLSNRFG